MLCKQISHQVWNLDESVKGHRYLLISWYIFSAIDSKWTEFSKIKKHDHRLILLLPPDSANIFGLVEMVDLSNFAEFYKENI